MSLFELDKTNCVRCGACVRDCSFGALKTDAAGYPFIKDEKRCMRCQHCFAVCPKGAITFDGCRAADSVATAGLTLPSAEAVENWLQVRRSVRRFQEADVDPATLDRILRLLGDVPTGCNARALTFICHPTRQSTDAFRQRFIHAVEEHRDGTKLLPRWLAVPAIKLRQGKADIFFRGAPGLLIITSDETDKAVTTPREDLAAACTYFEMLAHAHGLATCWCGFLQMVQKVVPELLEKTSGIRRTTPFCAMLFGRPALTYPRGVQRSAYAKVVYA